MTRPVLLVLGPTLIFAVAFAHSRSASTERIQQQLATIAELRSELSSLHNRIASLDATEALRARAPIPSDAAPVGIPTKDAAPSIDDDTEPRSPGQDASGPRSRPELTPSGDRAPSLMDAWLRSGLPDAEIAESIRQLMRAPREELVLDGLRALLEIDPSQALRDMAAVVSATRGVPEREFVALRAADLLEGLRSREADDLLFELFQQQESLALRVRAATLLAARGERRPSQSLGRELLERLESGDAVDRSRAVLALANLGDPSVVPQLAEQLRDASAEVRFSAVLALSQFERPQVSPDLQAMLRDTNPSVAALAAQLLR